MLKPTFDNVLIRRKLMEEKTLGGLFIPDSVRSANKLAEGEVIATGPGEERPNGVIIPTGVQPGDRVTWYPQTGTEMTVDGEEGLVIIKGYNLLGILSDDVEVSSGGGDGETRELRDAMRERHMTAIG